MLYTFQWFFFTLSALRTSSWILADSPSTFLNTTFPYLVLESFCIISLISLAFYPTSLHFTSRFAIFASCGTWIWWLGMFCLQYWNIGRMPLEKSLVTSKTMQVLWRQRYFSLHSELAYEILHTIAIPPTVILQMVRELNYGPIVLVEVPLNAVTSVKNRTYHVIVALKWSSSWWQYAFQLDQATNRFLYIVSLCLRALSNWSGSFSSFLSNLEVGTSLLQFLQHKYAVFHSRLSWYWKLFLCNVSTFYIHAGAQKLLGKYNCDWFHCSRALPASPTRI